jgi:hypothetical protein
MPRLCKDAENQGEICKKLIEKKICGNAKGGIQCKAKNGEPPGLITEEIYQNILKELGIGKPAPVPAPVPNKSRNANVALVPKQASVKFVEHVVANHSRNANVAVVPNGSRNANVAVVPNGSRNANVAVAANGSRNANVAVVPNGSRNANVAVVPNGSRNANVAVVPNGSRNANVAVVPNGSRNANVAGVPKESTTTDQIIQLVNTTESLEDLIKSELIRKSCNDYAKFLDDRGRQNIVKAVINLFQTVTSDNFYKLLSSLKGVITHEDIQSFRASVLEESSHPYLGYIVIKWLYHSVLGMVKKTHHDQNSSYKLLTDKNVLVTEDMENLDITDMDHLYELFERFQYFHKSSASTSLVFTARLKDLHKDFITEQTTLRPNQQFYFKAFPVGEVVNRYGNKVNYMTEGLQTELSMYEELFKLQKYNITPNILCKIALIPNITGFGEFLEKTKMLNVAKDMTFKEVNPLLYVPPETVWNRVSIISTHPGGPELYTIFQDLSPDERKEVMFQIIYNLYVFDKLEISQGDMHARNIKVNILSEPISLCYIVNGRTYAFETKHLVKFFDLDFGMIGKTTNLKFDYNGNVTDTINKIVNPNRSPDNWRNYKSGITDIYNPNLDIVKLFMNGAVGLVKKFAVLLREDLDFIQFIKLSLPGIFNNSKIRDTYRQILKDPEYKKEAVKIYGIENITKWQISESVFDSSWNDYLIKCGNETTGYIVKDFEKPVPNNQLWIPNTIIATKHQMLKGKYFNNFYKGRVYPIDVTKQMVYSIDGVIA